MPMGVYQHFHVSWCGPSVVLLVVVVVVVVGGGGERKRVESCRFFEYHEPLGADTRRRDFFPTIDFVSISNMLPEHYIGTSLLFDAFFV